MRERAPGADVSGFVTQVGEGFSASGGDAAHVNTLLGAKGGPASCRRSAWTSCC